MTALACTLRTRGADLGLLALRVGTALLVWRFHVLRKLADLGSELQSFPDPLGIGHAPSLVMALAAEGGCSLLVAIGFATRLMSLPVVFTMLMVLFLAARGFEGADLQSALLYALPYVAIALAGPGYYSLDHRLARR
jgi:putative oxidoreductase